MGGWGGGVRGAEGKIPTKQKPCHWSYRYGVPSQGWEGISENEQGSPKCKIALVLVSIQREETGKKGEKKKERNCTFQSWTEKDRQAQTNSPAAAMVRATHKGSGTLGRRGTESY